MQPEQATFALQEVFLPMYKNEHRTTCNIIQAVPVDKSDYRPDDISMTALALAWHIASSEMRFLDSVAAGAFDTSPRPRPETIQNSADLLAWYQENFQSRMATVTAMSGEDLAKIIDFRGMLQMPAVMMLGFCMRHAVHHRGQLSTYLRPMGAKVPAIYGESYDSAAARKAAQG
jgi:uncharacterized damage-inducible protein DinB